MSNNNLPAGGSGSMKHDNVGVSSTVAANKPRRIKPFTLKWHSNGDAIPNSVLDDGKRIEVAPSKKTSWMLDLEKKEPSPEMHSQQFSNSFFHWSVKKKRSRGKRAQAHDAASIDDIVKRKKSTQDQPQSYNESNDSPTIQGTGLTSVYDWQQSAPIAIGSPKKGAEASPPTVMTSTANGANNRSPKKTSKQPRNNNAQASPASPVAGSPQTTTTGSSTTLTSSASSRSVSPPLQQASPPSVTAKNTQPSTGQMPSPLTASNRLPSPATTIMSASTPPLPPAMSLSPRPNHYYTAGSNSNNNNNNNHNYNAIMNTSSTRAYGGITNNTMGYGPVHSTTTPSPPPPPPPIRCFIDRHQLYHNQALPTFGELHSSSSNSNDNNNISSFNFLNSSTTNNNPLLPPLVIGDNDFHRIGTPSSNLPPAQPRYGPNMGPSFIYLNNDPVFDAVNLMAPSSSPLPDAFMAIKHYYEGLRLCGAGSMDMLAVDSKLARAGLSTAMLDAKYYHVPVPMMLYDTNSVIIWTNPAFEHMTKIPRQKHVGTNSLNHVDYLNSALLADTMRHLLTERPKKFEVQTPPIPICGEMISLRCWGDRIDCLDGTPFGYLWQVRPLS